MAKQGRASKPKEDEAGAAVAAALSAPAGRPSSLLNTRVIYCGDCLEQLKKLPDRPALVDGSTTMSVKTKIIGATMTVVFASELSKHHHQSEHLHDETPYIESAPTVAEIRPPKMFVEYRAGPMPATSDEPEKGLLLARLEIDSSFASETVATSPALASGTVGHIRVTDGDGKTIRFGRVTGPHGDGDIVFENNTVVAGGTVLIRVPGLK